MLKTLLAAVAIFAAGQAMAQTAPAVENPLRPRRAPALQQPAAQTPAAQPAPAAQTAAPAGKRARSEKQLKNDQAMRDCGADWRANKAALQAKGQTWKTYMPACRKQKLSTV